MSSNPHVQVVVGARPNFVKVAPLWQRLQGQERLRLSLIHTGQHYDYAMSQVFFEQLEIPRPHRCLDVGSQSHTRQTAEVLQHMEDVLLEDRPDVLVVIGDVNSTPAAALAAVKLGIPVAHVEAGLRSFDGTMPEEVNRILTDRMSTLLFATEPAALANLQREGFDAAAVHLVGNVMIDALHAQLPAIRARGAPHGLALGAQPYVVLTAHRPATVDTPEGLTQLCRIAEVAAGDGLVVFPVHPRTRSALERCGLSGAFERLPNVRMVKPMGYVDFMSLVDSAYCVLTDSGGLQSEAAGLRVPCITLREVTEHVITVEHGSNRLAGLDPDRVAAALEWARHYDRRAATPPPLWDGHAAERIVAVLNQWLDRPREAAA